MGNTAIAERYITKTFKWYLIISAILFGIFLQSNAQAFTVAVVDKNGNPVNGFRWVLEEDNTHFVIPGQIIVPDGSEDSTIDPPTLKAVDSLSLSIHKSYAPVVQSGSTINAFATINADITKRYFISVLPSGHTVGGTPIAVGQTNVTVTVNTNPIPTAQISVLIFEDNNPINNSPDAQEKGLEGVSILLFDAAGLYGVAGGHITQDAFGNPLGTTYNPGGTVNTLGSGSLITDVDGKLLIQNLAPGKYGVQAVPPAGEDWHQTSTLEGGKTIDTMVKAGEPSFFQEFGPPGYHVFIGFVKSLEDTAVLNGNHSIGGTVVNLHNSRPPDFTFHPGNPIPNCWIGLNDLAVGVGRGIYAKPCDTDSSFTINNVPPGSYELIIWDEFLDVIIAKLGVTMNPDGSCLLAGGTASATCDLGDVPVFAWFGKFYHNVFVDTDEDGFRDPGETGILEQAVNLRFRNGTIYQSYPTDLFGFVPFDEVFPFFRWLVAEVDFTRFKSTGATIIVDAGGAIPPDDGWDMPSSDILTPQPQFCTEADLAAGTLAQDPDGIPGTLDDVPCQNTTDQIINPNTGNNLSRTIKGEVLTQAFQSFLGTTSIIDWGKSSYGPGENGGITGIVYYATTRAEDDPEYAVGEEWEPGIPRIQVNLYKDSDNDKVIDDLNGDGVVTLADVDNYPLGWSSGGAKGNEDVDYNVNGIFDGGDAIQVTTTDSWDDNLPTGCPGEVGTQAPFYVNGDPLIHAQDCFEGLRTFNQIRDGLFDGGYAFASYMDPYFDAVGASEVDGLPEDTYIVEAIASPGYIDLKSEDRNVDFGDEYDPTTLLLPPACVGEPYTVPPEFSLFPGEAAPLAGQTLPLCNRKQVLVRSGMTGGGLNAAADFFMFTEAPKAGRIVGMIMNDLANEFDPNAPAFGEKFAPPFVPVSIRDFSGKEISRVYSDKWGQYNALVPSTYSVNLPMPSGVSPNMLTTCMNDPGPINDPDNPGSFIIDPHFQRQYSQFCYTFMYMPGTTTYLDTPVLPIGAFAGANQFPLDCEFSDETPVIYSVSGPTGGPYVSDTGQFLKIVSAGPIDVLNPAYDGTNSKTITRDFGFGTIPGSVTLGGVELTNKTWTDGVINGTVPPSLSPGSYQLEVTRSDGKPTVAGITVTVDDPLNLMSVHHVSAGGSIQAAIDAASDGDLILVAPGAYEELVILYKDVNLQGWGAASTSINAVKAPAEKAQEWLDKMATIIPDPATSPYLLPGQGALFELNEGPGIIVLGRSDNSFNGRIDGFEIFGASVGGGIFVNGYTDNFEISNNQLIANNGLLGGGITVGHPFLLGIVNITDGQNTNISIHNNKISQNGTSAEGIGGGGGIALYNGTDNYEVSSNFICGNFSGGSGGGIGHLGLSDGGMIAHNTITFNQTFSQDRKSTGGGIFIGGAVPTLLDPISPGSGSVTIDSNLIQANLAGAGDGGGVRTEFVNAQDVVASPNDSSLWHSIDIINNMIVNNVTGLAGGAISMQDTTKINIINNTIANNDSTATAGAAFTSDPNVSSPQAAGIVTRAHSVGLTGILDALDPAVIAPELLKTFSNPTLIDNIIWHNRSFFWDSSLNGGVGGLSPDPATPAYNDLAVLGTLQAEKMNPIWSILTDRSGYDGSNLDEASDGVDPTFVSEYFNGPEGFHVIPEFTTSLETVPAFDEGGNYIDVRFGPLTLTDPATGLLFGDYHVQTTSPAINRGIDTGLITDFDGENRPDVTYVDRGADEVPGGTLQGNYPPVITSTPITSAFEVYLYSYQIMAADPDPADTLTYSLDAASVAEGMTLDAAGLIQWTPLLGQGFSAPGTPYNVIVDVSDGSNIVQQLFTIRVLTQAADLVPVPEDQAVTTTEAVPVDITLSYTDPDGPGPYTFTIVGAPTDGSFNGTDADGDAFVTYTPDPGFGSSITEYDTFTFRVNDGMKNSDDVDPNNLGTVTITVTPLGFGNTAPVAYGQAASTFVNTPEVITLLAIDADDHPLTYNVPVGGAGYPTNGDLTVLGLNTVTYTPDTDYIGTDSFTFTANDGFVDSNVATVTIQITDASVGTTVFVQCPGDIDGDAIPDPFLQDGVTPNPGFDPNVRCKHLAGGDGFIKMADDRLQYIFSFSDITGTPEDQAVDTGILAANFPAPTISLDEGDEFYLTMTNVGMAIRPDLFDSHTIHYHGFPEASAIFDGVPEASIAPNQLASVTYYYNLALPGTYMYHCHFEATEHMQMGMLGNLYVRPAQNRLADGTCLGGVGPSCTGGHVHSNPDYDPDRNLDSPIIGDKYAYNDGDGSTYYDVEYPVQIHTLDPDFHDASMNVQPLPFAKMKDTYGMLNGRGYPDTINTSELANTFDGKLSQKINTLITATQNQKILLRISSLSTTSTHTLTAPGLLMKVIGKDAMLVRGPDGKNLYYDTNSVTVSGGETIDVIIDTTGVPAGTYFLYTTRLNYLSNNTEDLGGMMTEIVINPVTP